MKLYIRKQADETYTVSARRYQGKELVSSGVTRGVNYFEIRNVVQQLANENRRQKSGDK